MDSEGLFMISNDRADYFKYMPLLGMLYITLMLAALVLIYKPFSVGFILTTCAGLISPFNFVLGDIIAEVYGYKIARRILIFALICQLVFCLLITYLSQLPSPETWKMQSYYDYVMNDFLKIYFSVVIGYFISNIINMRLITKWKILLKGKYFWLRSIGSSGIGEIVYSIITGVIIFAGTMPFNKLVTYVTMLFVFKLLATVIFAFPANLIANILKIVEGVKDNDVVIRFNAATANKNA